MTMAITLPMVFLMMSSRSSNNQHKKNLIASLMPMSMAITLPMVFLVMSSRSSNYIGFMTSNMLTVMILLVSFLTNSVDYFLTLLNVDGVNNLLASCLGDLARVLMGMLVALLLLLVFTLRTTVVSIFSSIS